MYQNFFNLREPPFSISPDPRFLYLGRHHREALAHLLYSVRGSSGFILLTGEVGAGKTTVSRCLVRQTAEQVDVALIFNPRLTALELVASICDELHVSYPETANLKVLYDALNRHLLESYASNRITVLILDEAQSLSVDLLEQVRLLSNLETDRKKLLQIILIGQPELLTLMAQPELRQFSQRVTARYHIAPLNLMETREFVQHRLAVAGCKHAVFDLGAFWVIHRAAQGIPRLINQMCDRAMLGAYTLGRHRVNFWIARTAVREVLGRSRRPVRHFLLLLLIVTGLFGMVSFLRPEESGMLLNMAQATLRSASERFQNEWFRRVQQSAEESRTPPSFPVSLPVDSPPQPKADMGSKEGTPVDPVPQPKADTGSKEGTPVDPVPQPKADTGSKEGTPVDPVPQPKADTGSEEGTPVVTPLPGYVVEQWMTKDLPLAVDAPTRVVEPKALLLETIVNTPEETAYQQPALRHLFGLWGVDQKPLEGDASCERAASVGLSCKDLVGNWRVLRQLGVPVIIQWVHGNKKPRYAVVTALGRKQVTLQFARRAETFPRDVVDQYWSGRMILVWRVMPGQSTYLDMEMQGEDVIWLRGQLARTRREESTSPGSDLFDAELQARLRQFQTQVALFPDGQAGFRSVLALDLALQDARRPTPRLRLLPDGDD